MTQHRLNRRSLFLLQLQSFSDVLTGLGRSAHEVQHKGAVASCSRVLRLCIHSRITTSQNSLQLIGLEGLQAAWNVRVALS